jgi:hypothetical protein
MFFRTRLLGVLGALVSFAAVPTWAAADGRFSVSVGSHDDLMIALQDGTPLTSVAAPTLDKTVKINDRAFKVSYGRDANGQLTAIFAPKDSDLISLHFSAGGKNIDADKAVVTVTFAPNLKSVLVDPGYVGTVEVDSHVLRAHDLAADEHFWNAPPAAAPAPTLAATTATTSDVSAPASDATPAPAATEPSTPATANSDPADAPASAASLFAGPGPSLASQLHPILPPTAPDVAPTPTATAANDLPKGPMKLYWAEPVTGPDGSAPPIALDEVKLVELHGTVTVVLPNGESENGTDGLVIPSGSTVRTADNSTVAVFMGGVNSARMMPRCELVVTQEYAGSLRTNIIDLHRGAVFSRVGHRPGETENYTVRTPEGSTKGESDNMLAFRGTPDDVRYGASTTRSGLALDPKQLLAWNPPASHGLISDVAQEALGIQTPYGRVPDTYFYFTGGLINYTTNQIRTEVLTNYNSHATSQSQSEPDYILQGIMLALQPFNYKLKTLLNAINNATETPAQLTYYHNLVTVFFDHQSPTLVQDFLNHKPGLYKELNVDSAILYQDLREFALPALTPK